MKRKSGLATIITILLALALLLVWAPEGIAKVEGKVRHIILFIGDGMQLEHEIATSRYLYGRDYGLVFHLFPYRTNVATWDVTTYNKYATSRGVPPYDPAAIDPLVGYDPAKGGKKPYPLQTEIEESYFLAKLAGKEPATDSASAATAWATGYKTDDGNLAWLPGDVSGRALKTIAELVRDEKGMAIGVVSTVPFTHATPAAHVSHNVNRNNYHAIADEIMKNTRPEVVIGGGYPFGGSFTYISQQLYTDIKNNTGNMFADYVSLERASGVDGGKALLAAAKQAKREGKRLFGLFGGAGGNLESPVPTDTPGTPSISRGSSENPLLKDCVVAALEVLGRDKDGFFVMIEQGDIDWANHANDYQRMIGTTWDLNEAVKAAIDFVNRPGDQMNWSNTLLIVTSDHANSCMRLNDEKRLGKGDLPPQDGTCSYGGPACTYPNGEVMYSTVNHTNELVRLYALGKGAHLFARYEGDWYPGTRIIDNTHIFHVLTEVAGIAQESPLQIGEESEMFEMESAAK